MNNLESGNVKVIWSEQDEGHKLEFHGEIDMEDPSIDLRPYLERFHQHIVSHAIKKVTADFTSLEFMNSSGIKEMVNWIMRLNTTKEEKKYNIEIRYNSDITWQGNSLPILQRLQPNHITVVS